MNALRNKVIAPAMSREEWEALPPAVRYFIPWQKAKHPMTIKKVQPPTKAKAGKT
jgi:hypothetical protein